MAAADRPPRIAALVLGGDSTVPDVVRRLTELNCIAIGVDPCQSRPKCGDDRVRAHRRLCGSVIGLQSGVVSPPWPPAQSQMGVAAYVRIPCTQRRLREMTKRLATGEWLIDIAHGPAVMRR